MPENQKDKKDGTVEKDQKERGYYYDDAHGYEDFDPEKEDAADEERDEGEGKNATRGVSDRGTGGERDAESERRGDAAVKPQVYRAPLKP